ncbi:MAG: type II toxin-antitoxin system HicB family antitoxin [Methanothrix sp.]|jgi:predicted RNase H-like HicB family nuclease|nr:type II toxin-antitoxin system HicB family antitoxin [Methanothrix sp.]
MFAEYIQAALEKAQYKVIDNGDEPFFVDVPELDGVWATGCTIEDARRNFIESLEDWIAAHLLWNLALPPIGSHTICVSKEPIPVA